MRPFDLKPTASRKERKVVIEDSVFYAPDSKEDNFQFPGWSHPSIFLKEQPIHIEYCSGNGDWIAAKALAYPELNWVAVEQQFSRVCKIWAKLKNFNLPNLLIICGEGLRLTMKYLPSDSVDHAYVNFPDPWPKRRHGKNRIIQTPFVSEVSRILKKNGKFTLVTDDEPYSKQMIAVLNDHPHFNSEYPAPFYTTTFEGYGNSYFENIWREQGKVIHYHVYRKGE